MGIHVFLVFALGVFFVLLLVTFGVLLDGVGHVLGLDVGNRTEHTRLGAIEFGNFQVREIQCSSIFHLSLSSLKLLDNVSLGGELILDVGDSIGAGIALTQPLGLRVHEVADDILDTKHNVLSNHDNSEFLGQGGRGGVVFRQLAGGEGNQTTVGHPCTLR
eukprot:TRINITY_DN4368_c0_g1_i10.p1 TRINITY_DN4368_c0_g1~~TRINITY_DN4368_c0_g1_i10.p1  ORF type:complete len:161 (-),score=26.40 TRINITY_DN4368_c0_g1_i10:19-501(-)